MKTNIEQFAENNFFKQIRSIPEISIQKEKELIDAAQNDDLNAKQELMESKLKLVLKHTMKVCKDKKYLLDSFQEGVIALSFAIDYYNPVKMDDIPFNSYAGIVVRRRIHEFLAKKVTPYHISNASAFLKIAIDEHMNKLQESSEPLNIKKLAEELECSESLILLLMFLPKDYVPMVEDPTTEIKNNNFPAYADNRWNPEEISRKQNNLDLVHGLIEPLNEKEKTLLLKKHGLYPFTEPSTFLKMAQELKVSYQAVQYKYKNSINKIRRTGLYKQIEFFFS